MIFWMGALKSVVGVYSVAQKKVKYHVERKDFCQSLDHFSDHMTNYWFGTHQISYQARYRNNLLGQKSTTTSIGALGQ